MNSGPSPITATTTIAVFGLIPLILAINWQGSEDDKTLRLVRYSDVAMLDPI